MPVRVTCVTPQPRRLEARVTLPGTAPVDLFVETNVDVVRDATPWVPAVVPLAMWAGTPLVVEGLVDPVVVDDVARAQRVLHEWYPRLRPVAVTSKGPSASVDAAPGVGCFFSGGVDSFFSLLRHRDRVTHLVFVHGFDIPLGRVDLARRALDAARQATLALDKTLIEVRTDLRALSDGRVDWQTAYHGAALATVGHALGDHLGRLIVPGSYAEADLHPWGTHPDLDPWWSGSRVTFEHDSVDVTRPEKVRALTAHPVAMDHLRVCFKNPDGAYNCGRCEKCLRTMISLAGVGALDRCKTLPAHLDPRDVRRMKVSSLAAHLFVTENIDAIAALPPGERDEELLAALRFARRMGHLRRRVRGAGRPVMRTVVRPLRRRLRRRWAWAG